MAALDSVAQIADTAAPLASEAAARPGYPTRPRMRHHSRFAVPWR
jgi:hypothetical protein